MGKKNKAPKAPKGYKKLIDATIKATQDSYQLSQDQLAWAKQTYANDKEILDRVTNASLARQNETDQWAREDRARYTGTFQPLEDELVADARSYASPERQEFEAGRASAEVAQTFDAARENAARNLESFGVDPSSTRFAALDLGARVQQAAAQAGAANQGRLQAEETGRNLRMSAIDIGRGMPAQIAGTQATAMQSGNSGANTQLAGTASGASTMGTGVQWSGAGTGAANAGSGLLNGQFAAQNAAYKTQQESSSGIGGLIGAGLGVAQNAGWLAALSEGGTVPPTASPTGGRAIDDVDARLTAGEFVIPREAVSWYGEKHFQQLIEKSKKEREGATAKPSAALVPDRPPTFTSRPQSALALG
jgi:hypothetical protein